MASRTLGPQQSKKPTIQAPERKVDWQRLMRAAIARAEQIGSPQVHGLRKALADGQSEAFLRRLGVIHEGDIDREFPLP